MAAIAPAQPRAVRRRDAALHVVPPTRDRAADPRAGAAVQAEQRGGDGALAGAGLADQAERAARVERNDSPSTARTAPRPEVDGGNVDASRSSAPTDQSALSLMQHHPSVGHGVQHVRDGVGDDHDGAGHQHHADDHRQVDDVDAVDQLLPMPGMPKSVSVSTAPPSTVPRSSALSAMTGGERAAQRVPRRRPRARPRRTRGRCGCGPRRASPASSCASAARTSAALEEAEGEPGQQQVPRPLLRDPRSAARTAGTAATAGTRRRP